MLVKPKFFLQGDINKIDRLSGSQAMDGLQGQEGINLTHSCSRVSLLLLAANSANTKLCK